jgi:hypothetical protein
MPADVIITLSDGSVTIDQAPTSTRIEVRDYDVVDDWDGAIEVDECGNRYQVTRFVGAGGHVDVAFTRPGSDAWYRFVDDNNVETV